MKKVFFLTLLMCLGFVSPAQACRFWVAVGDQVPADYVYSQLVESPYSLKLLGAEYNDGWSVAGYVQKEAHVIRSSRPSNMDEEFEKAVAEISQRHSGIVLGHLRKASSGCLEGVPNPHPFKRAAMGKEWMFGHNGGMKKEVLIELIGGDYLEKNPPATCTDNAPDSWIDSELYFIFLLKKIEESQGNVVQGLQKGLSELYEMIDESERYLNFFLSDGKSVWAFRKGNSLFYKFDNLRGIGTISSTVPGLDLQSWNALPESTIAVLNPGEDIQFFPL